MTAEKLLPQDIAAEMATLGCLIDNRDAVARAVDGLGLAAEDFYRAAHRTIYRAIVRLYCKDESDIDFITLTDELRRSGELEGVGGESYVTSLVNQIPPGGDGDVERYAKIVQRCSRQRQWIKASGQVAALAYSELDADDLAERAEQIYAEVRAKSTPTAPKNDNGGMISARDLMAKKFAPVVEIVPGLITEGLNVLSGKPKMGKSWLLLALAIARSGGGRFLSSIPLDRGPVLYLALEDTEQSLQDRMRITLQGAPVPEDLTLATVCSLQDWHMNNGGLDRIGRWLAEHEHGCVIVDTLAKIQPVRRGNGNGYAEDYAVGAQLKELADTYHAAVIVVTHNRKAAADDPLDEINATTGLMGAFDTGLVLRRTRGEADAVLHTTGRRIRDAELALQFDATTCLWSLMGSAREYAVSGQRRAILQAVTEIVQATGKPAPRKAIAEATGMKSENIGYLLTQMVNASQIRATSSGYLPISPNTPNSPNNANTPNSPNGPESVRGVRDSVKTPNTLFVADSRETIGADTESVRGVRGVRDNHVHVRGMMRDPYGNPVCIECEQVIA